MTSMVAVQIVGLQLEPVSGVPVILLGETMPPTRVLPIIIGPFEARSIALAVAGLIPPRPGTHDLMVDVIEHVDSRLEEVSVTELVDETFFAALFIEAPSGLHRISARPSDAIALAVRTGVPISVHADVLDAAAVTVRRESAEPFTDDEIDDIVGRFQNFLSTAQPSDFDPPAGDGA
jgi:bifunctional DNase/RNase